MDDIVLALLMPFLKQIVSNRVDVRTILTEENKENILYKYLEEGKDLPNIENWNI